MNCGLLAKKRNLLVHDANYAAKLTRSNKNSECDPSYEFEG
jgi:hypothetical protein